jgi:hypothetical protein
MDGKRQAETTNSKNDLLFKNKKKEKCIFILLLFISIKQTSYTVFYKHQINSFSKLNDSSILKLCINLRYTFNILIVLIIV